MPPLPPFLQMGEDQARFYALAYCPGVYVGHSDGMEPPSSLVLFYSTSPNFTRFSHHVIHAGGHCLAYSRGLDDFDSPEFALLYAWQKFLVPPIYWRLYPRSAVPGEPWPEWDGDRQAYLDARAVLCRILRPLRIFGRSPVESLFRADPEPAPDRGEQAAEEAREILEAAMAAYRRGSDGGQGSS